MLPVKILFSKTDENGFPNYTTLYYFPFVQWPRPKGINVETNFRKYIEVNNFNIQKLKTGKEIGMSGGNDRYALELLSGSHTIHQPMGIVWNSEELARLLTKCEQWWDADKHYLQDENYKSERLGGSIYEEFLKRFTNLVQIITNVFGYRSKSLTASLKKRLTALILDMENQSVPVLKAKIVFGLYDSYEDYLKQLQITLISKDNRIIVDGFESTIFAVHSSPYQAKPDFRKKLLTVLSIALDWRITDLMGHVFSVIEDFIKNSDLELGTITGSIYSSLQWILDLQIDADEMQLELGDFLLLKRYSVSLAGALIESCIEKGSTVPQSILNWKALSEDENEFGDIKNRWKCDTD